MKQTNVLLAVVVALVLVAALIAACQVAQPTEEPAGIGGRTQVIRPLIVENDARVDRNLAVAGDVAVGDGLTVSGALGVGAGYVLENPSEGRIVEFGATGAITSTAITPVAISTVTAYGCTVNNPSAAAQLCYAQSASGIITMTIYNAAATPAPITTPRAAGASFWIGGN